MAAKMMNAYLSTVVPDYTAAMLTLAPSGTMVEDPIFYQEVKPTDDPVIDEVITHSTNRAFMVTLSWDNITESEAGDIIDMYNLATKANGFARSFVWEHPIDGSSYKYTVFFRSKVPRSIASPNIHSIKSIKLKVVGNYVP
jgi:hypothetical protein